MTKSEIIKRIRAAHNELRDLKNSCMDAFEMMQRIDDISYELDNSVDEFEETINSSKE